ncbi:hypothetical protein Scep_020983 [Stephania cephalantha]|uniref:Bifunctional inhibitor/plant lipid transfer protein/seed storage helical domain-containing protein n=1 Tax=Stephania cephalantha TaxID=152367 RepID=A0AAP0FBY8_9MAGN
MMRPSHFLVLHILFLAASVIDLAFSASPIQNRCGNDLTQVTKCLDYGTGKAAQPSSECCSAVKDIRTKDPACLCFFIQQVHSGRAELKSLGLQEARILQLSSACGINATLSDCIKLLNLSPSSPDYDFFKNSTKATVTPATATPPSAKNNDSLGYVHKPYLSVTAMITIATAIFISLSPTGLRTSFLF